MGGRRGGRLCLLAGAGALAALLSNPGHAFEARIVREDGSPVALAHVSILGRTGLGRTDAQGRFRWSPDPPVPFEVVVVLPGGAILKPIAVEALPAEGLLLLEARPAVEENLSVTTGAAPGIEGAPASATVVLPSREFEARRPANLSQLLENVPGVSPVSEGQAAVPAIRGMARGRTLVLIDGARVTTERRVGPSATFLDPVTLESVEVSRGPATVAYGSDAFGGVIMARTRGAVPGSRFGARFVGSLSTGVPERGASLELSRGFASAGVLVQGHWREAGDYEAPEGQVLNSGFRDYGVRARVDRATPSGLLTLAWQSDLGREIERPRSDSGTVRFFYPTEDSHRLTASYDSTRAGAWSRLGWSAFLGSYALVTDQDRHATVGAPRTVERSDVRAKDFHLRGFAERPWRAARFEVGADVNGRFGLEAQDVSLAYREDGSLESADTAVSVADARRLDAAVHATVEAAASRKASLSAGLRLDRITTRNEAGFFGDRATANGALSGFGAATFGPFSGLTATVQAARGFRDPVLSDRYFVGPTGRGFVTGNPELDPETSLQLDGSLRFSRGRFRGALHAYRYRIDDLVERYETDPDAFFFRNRGRARLQGAEVELESELGARLRVALAAHVVRGRTLDDGRDLDDTPPDTLTVQLRRELGSRGFVQVRAAFHAAQDRPGPNERAREGFNVVDLSGGYRFAETVEVRALVRNLLDASYLASPDSRAIPAPGRSAVVTTSWSF